MKFATNPTGKTLVFEELDHTYTIKETGQRLTSCTQFIKSFFPDFDREYHAKRVAEDRGQTSKEIIDEWEEISRKAREFGKSVHAFADEYTERNIPILISNDQQFIDYCNVVKDAIDYLKSTYEFIASEKMLFSEKLGLAGTTDLLFRDGKTLLILDWKTGREIQEKDIFKVWKDQMRLPFKAKFPIEHIEDCNFNHYSLQLNLYKRLIIEENYFPEIKFYKMLFFHFRREELELKVESHIVKSLDEDIDKMLKHSLEYYSLL